MEVALLALYDGLSRINASGVLLLTGLTNEKMSRQTTTADLPGLKEAMMMKSVSICKVILSIILWALVFVAFGCGSWQSGETVAEGRRRHKRVLSINRQEMMADIDKVMLLDKPSKLTDKRIP